MGVIGIGFFRFDFYNYLDMTNISACRSHIPILIIKREGKGLDIFGKCCCIISLLPENSLVSNVFFVDYILICIGCISVVG